MKERETGLGAFSSFIESNWGIKPRKVSFIEEGNSTNNWKVLDNGMGRYVLRNAGRFRHYVRLQCDILNFLREKEFPYLIPMPVRASINDFVVDTEEGSYFLYKYIDGEVLRNVTVEDACQVGLMLAMYHDYIADFDWRGYQQLRSKDLLDEPKMVQFIKNCRQVVEEKENKTEMDATFLSEINDFIVFYAGILKKTDIAYYHSLPQIPCHGDFDRRNILKKEDRVVGFIDLGGITIDPPICDLQSCIQLNCMRNGELNLDTAKAIFDGYASCRRFNRDQLELIDTLLYSEMLKTLCWVMAELAKPESRVDETEASDRMKMLILLKNNKYSLNGLLV